jgi:hypothetical protein
MGQASPGKQLDNIDVDPGAQKRLAEDLKRALEIKSSRHGSAPKRERPAKGK